ncbi:PREDICTED: uncharacterized protein LOC105451493 [Wasmannia auropunctata]|uniref:uncharacterized protein LOC105451493 n=1 Tax=Wasmannia auropunctata TaxID=64793 RepID=UPI0005EFECD8|nr:PREDICTED: uncharacterized protein LOC105451493 [Wasmannia auropunctata]
MLPLILLVVGVFAQQTFAEEPEAIVGGEPASPGEFPHQVSLRLDGSHVCGGSIIAPNKILTAAHCVVGIAYPPYSNYKVATGTNSISGGEIHTVKSILVHPQYSDKYEDAWKNDIAVITLVEPIKYNQYQQPIALTTTKPTPGQACTLSGWGLIRTNGPLPRNLQKMTQVVVAQNKCQDSHYEMPLTGSHLCTINRYGIGACSGDSGGPLISKGVQIGVTSWVLPCARGEPDVYTDVYYHRNFIQQALYGSIINQTKILTAASCVNYIVDSPYLSNFTIVTGTINTTGGEIHTVKNIIIHSGYTGKLTNSFQNDIAIITLTDSIKYNQNQKPITLAITEPTHKQKCTLTRWGSIKTNDGSIKSILEKMDEDVIDRKRGNNFDIRLRNTQLCAFNRLRNGNCMKLLLSLPVSSLIWPKFNYRSPIMLPFIFLVVGVLAQQTFAEEPEKIVGGTPAALGEFPHQCSLRLSGSHICGCSIIGSTKILTAAHCVDGMARAPYSNFKVATGSISVKGGEIHNVQKVVVHPRYTGKQQDAWNNDVAVITLSNPIQFNANQKPIALTDSPPTAGQKCTLSGWGKISTNGPLANSLLKMEQSVVGLPQCQQIHRGMPLDNSHLCTLNRAGIGACQGDSGGPLISNGVQIGITSWVMPCAQGYPDAYANVYHLRNFILSN